jgi:hypothetical protein
MKYILTNEELTNLVEESDNMYEKGMEDMWNIIRSEIDKYYYLNGESDNGILVILDSIKERAKIHYNNCYHDYKSGF